jgi:hypothetical protein
MKNCPVIRRKLRKSGTLNMATGQMTYTSETWVTEPCGTPIFGDGEECSSCRKGWSVPENYRAAPAGYDEIGAGYSVAELRVGMVVRNPEGKEVYVQPGDDAATMRENIASLDEVSEDVDDAKRANIVAMLLGDYFTGS